ncbi:MAG: cell division protein FtsK [Alphaproteobacteria bacterium]|nr:cell division protein FtsK [Alphaproteobacteria bacterium]
MSSRESFLPQGANEFLRRRFAELVGATLGVLALLLAAALISYSSADPSLNNATGTAPRNWLGNAGAYVADLALQLLGGAALLVVPALAAWAWRLLSHRGLPFSWIHPVFLLFSLVLATILAASVGPTLGWNATDNLGGFVGGVLLDRLQALGRWSGADLPVFLYAAFAAVLLVPVLAVAFALSRGEWGAMSRRTWWTMVKLWLLGRGAARIAQSAAAASGKRLVELSRRERVEPKLFGSGGAIETENEPRLDGDGAAREPLVIEPSLRGDPVTHAEPDEAAAKRVTPRLPRPARSRREAAEAQPALNLEDDFQLPTLNLLAIPKETGRSSAVNEEALEQNARMLEAVLDDFGVKGEITKVRPGPVVTLYELEPARGTKTSRVIGLSDDIARSMSAVSVRVAVIPGHNAIGIELPNSRRETVFLRELLSTPEYENTGASLPLALGKDIGGAPIVADLTRMPHLLVAGTTGSGKSVAVNSMILSILYRLRPDQCRLIMIDPKMLELSVYDHIPHLLAPVVTEPGRAVVALKWAVREMEARYRAMSQLGVRNITGYNQRLAEAKKMGEVLKRTVQTGFDETSGEPIFEEQTLDLEPMPFIIVVVDEMADLMLIAGKEIEASVQRLAQMARAAGIHLIMATQRPSVDVITGTIKANFPTRISFQVTSKIDSRTILGESGAETLLGSGDMLYMQSGGKITRVHGPFVSDGEVEAIVQYLRKQGEPKYIDGVTDEPEDPRPSLGESPSDDPLFDQAVDLVCREGKCSTSFVQRHLQIGYNRAARIVERMEAEGMVSQANHVGKREVLARVIRKDEE